MFMVVMVIVIILIAGITITIQSRRAFRLAFREHELADAVARSG